MTTVARDQFGGAPFIFGRIYGQREDAESINRGIDDALYLRRARSVGALRQHYDLIAHARGVNALARFLHRKRQAKRRASAA